ncbi:hypothetical protein D3C81_1437120 [compost metagenome]
MLEKLHLPGNGCRHQKPKDEHQPTQRERLSEQTCTSLLDQEHQARHYNQAVEQIVGPLRRPARYVTPQKQTERYSEILRHGELLQLYTVKPHEAPNLLSGRKQGPRPV